MDYRVTFRVSQAHLGLIFGLLQNEKHVSLENVVPVTNETPAATVHRGFKDGKRFKGISGHDLILEMTKGGYGVTRDQIKAAFIDKGFADSSHSAAISTAINAKLIVRDAQGLFRRNPVPQAK